MKKRYILILLILILSLTGCGKVDLKGAYKITDRLTRSLQEKTPDLSMLNSDEKKIYDKIIEENKEENLVLNLSRIKGEEPNTELDEIDTSNDDRVYKENGDYKIKYTDINWMDTDDTEYFMVTINGEVREFYKYLVPILYEDTHDKPFYSYRYRNSKKDGDYTYFYYESIGGFGGLTYQVNNKNVEDMTMIYTRDYEGGDAKPINTKVALIKALVVIFIVLAIFIAIVSNFHKISGRIGRDI